MLVASLAATTAKASKLPPQMVCSKCRLSWYTLNVDGE